MPSADFPHMLKHMTLAIYLKKGVRGSGPRRFLAAVEIAVSRMVEWGFLEKPALYGPPFPLTSKGRKRELKHRAEGPRKSKRFDALYKDVQAGFEGSDTLKQDETIENRDTRKQAAKDRRAYALASAGRMTSKSKPKTRRARKPKASTVRRAKRR